MLNEQECNSSVVVQSVRVAPDAATKVTGRSQSKGGNRGSRCNKDSSRCSKDSGRCNKDSSSGKGSGGGYSRGIEGYRGGQSWS